MKTAVKTHYLLHTFASGSGWPEEAEFAKSSAPREEAIPADLRWRPDVMIGGPTLLPSMGLILRTSFTSLGCNKTRCLSMAVDHDLAGERPNTEMYRDLQKVITLL